MQCTALACACRVAECPHVRVAADTQVMGRFGMLVCVVCMCVYVCVYIQDLQALADEFNDKRKKGLVQGHGSGFGGTGFKFNTEEEDKVKVARKNAAKEYGVEVRVDTHTHTHTHTRSVASISVGAEGAPACICRVHTERPW